MVTHTGTRQVPVLNISFFAALLKNLPRVTEKLKTESLGGGSENSENIPTTLAITVASLQPAAPFGIQCYQEVLRFFVSLLNQENSEGVVQIALSALTIIFEVGAESLQDVTPLMAIIKSDLCRNLFDLLFTDEVDVLEATLRVCFLMFGSLRSKLKLQFELFLTTLMELIEQLKFIDNFLHHELALDSLAQFISIPGFVTELFINYDCEYHCTNVTENIVKLISRRLLLVAGNSMFRDYEVKIIDVFFSILSSISSSKDEAEKPSTFTNQSIAELKERKKLLFLGIDLFNSKPEAGIKFLHVNGILNSDDPKEIVKFLRDSRAVKRKAVGGYLEKADNEVLQVFVQSFNFTASPINKALRFFLTILRLPSDPQKMSSIIKLFANQWHEGNKKAFAGVSDVAYQVAFSIIMLNIDLHHHNAKRLNASMTVETFVSTLRTRDGCANIGEERLTEIFNKIKDEDIMMQRGMTKAAKENALWWNLLVRGEGKIGKFINASDVGNGKQIFTAVWGLMVRSLCLFNLMSFNNNFLQLPSLVEIFEKSSNQKTHKIMYHGFLQAAAVACNFDLHEELDAIVTALFKLTKFDKIETIVQLGTNEKAMLVTKLIFKICIDFGDSLRNGWKDVVDLIAQLYRLELLVLEVDSFTETNGKFLLRHEVVKPEVTMLDSLYSFLNSEVHYTALEEKEIIKKTTKEVKKYQIGQIIDDSKSLHEQAVHVILLHLQTLMRSSTEENIAMFYLEFLFKFLMINRDRASLFWPSCCDFLQELMNTNLHENFLKYSITALFKLAAAFMSSREEASRNLQCLNVFIALNPQSLVDPEFVTLKMIELLKCCGKSIATKDDWSLVFKILEHVGAGVDATSEENHSSLVYPCKPQIASAAAFANSCEFLALLVKTGDFVDSHNIEACIRCLRIFIEVAMLDEANSEVVATQLLDTLQTLHVRTVKIFEQCHSESKSVWSCRVLEAIARMSMYSSSFVRSPALSSLQRGLIMQILTADEASKRFKDVIFPLMSFFRDEPSEVSTQELIEESRTRILTLASKAFLFCYKTLESDSNFNELWSDLLIYYESFSQLGADISETVFECLKNILSVMHSLNALQDADDNENSQSLLWEMTWNRVENFLPNLKEEVLKEVNGECLPSTPPFAEPLTITETQILPHSAD